MESKEEKEDGSGDDWVEEHSAMESVDARRDDSMATLPKFTALVWMMTTTHYDAGSCSESESEEAEFDE